MTEGKEGYPGFGDGCINRQRTLAAISLAQCCGATLGSGSRPAGMGWAPGHPSDEPDFCHPRRRVPRERPGAAELGAEERGRRARAGRREQRPGGHSPAPLLFQSAQRIILVLVISRRSNTKTAANEIDPYKMR